jgi:hypothetical protein
VEDEKRRQLAQALAAGAAGRPIREAVVRERPAGAVLGSRHPTLLTVPGLG